MSRTDAASLLKATIINEGTRVMLRANGESDRQHGINMHDGWKEVAEACGFPVYDRTPAREAYEDGYYGVK